MIDFENLLEPLPLVKGTEVKWFNSLSTMKEHAKQGWQTEGKETEIFYPYPSLEYLMAEPAERARLDGILPEPLYLTDDAGNVKTIRTLGELQNTDRRGKTLRSKP